MRNSFLLFALAGILSLASVPMVFAGDCGQACDACGCDPSGCCDSCDCDMGACCDGACDGCCDSSACGLCDHPHSLATLFRRDRCCRSYCSIFGGWNALSDYNGNDFENEFPPPSPAIREGSFKDGWSIGVARGHRLNHAIRSEVEFAFRSNTADQWNVNSVPVGRWSGHFRSYSLMANLFHDFANCDLLGCTPYLGGGIGIAFLDGDFSTSTLDLEIDDEAFAYQFIAGSSKSLNSNVDLFVEYRFFGTTEFKLMNNTPALPVQFGKDPYEANNVMLGLRFNH